MEPGNLSYENLISNINLKYRTDNLILNNI